MGHGKSFLLAAVLCCSSVGSASAELPPEYYEGLRKAAPEVLTIQVTSARIAWTGRGDTSVCDVVVYGRVREVVRSACGHRVGDVVEIRYRTYRQTVAIAGPAEVPVLHAGRVTTAYLEPATAGRALAPAARSWSFE